VTLSQVSKSYELRHVGGDREGRFVTELLERYRKITGDVEEPSLRCDPSQGHLGAQESRHHQRAEKVRIARAFLVEKSSAKMGDVVEAGMENAHLQHASRKASTEVLRVTNTLEDV
jgi:hypothetical protein